MSIVWGARGGLHDVLGDAVTSLRIILIEALMAFDQGDLTRVVRDSAGLERP